MSKKSAGLIIAGIVLLVLVVAAKSYVTLSPQYATSTGGTKGVPEMDYAGNVSYGEDAAMPGRGISMPAPSPMPPYYDGAGQTAAEVDQKIIKTGSLSLVVDHAQDSANKIIALAEGKGGFVQNSSVSENANGTHYGSVTIRVPSKEFESSVTAIRGFATLVQNESISGQDVTEQFSDLQAQLKNARAQEAQYLEIMKQARTVEEILSVQRELGNIRSQIESLQGRIQYLENVTSYSTISVSLSEEPSLNLPTREFRPLTIVKEALQALGVLAQELATFLIWFVIIAVGTLVPLGLVVYVIYRIVMRILARRGRPPMNLRR